MKTATPTLAKITIQLSRELKGAETEFILNLSDIIISDKADQDLHYLLFDDISVKNNGTTLDVTLSHICEPEEYASVSGDFDALVQWFNSQPNQIKTQQIMTDLYYYDEKSDLDISLNDLIVSKNVTALI